MATKRTPAQKRFVTRWIKALESGDYRKAIGTMARVAWGSEQEVEYCCLGVMCELTKLPKINHINPKVYFYIFKKPNLPDIYKDTMPDIEYFEEKTGFTLFVRDNLASLNDKTHSFAWVIGLLKACNKAKYVEDLNMINFHAYLEEGFGVRQSDLLRPSGTSPLLRI